MKDLKLKGLDYNELKKGERYWFECENRFVKYHLVQDGNLFRGTDAVLIGMRTLVTDIDFISYLLVFFSGGRHRIISFPVEAPTTFKDWIKIRYLA